MKPAEILFGLCLVVIAGFGGAGVASAQTPIRVECKAQQIVLPAKNVEVTFENKGMCNDHASATKKASDGKQLSAKDAERVKLVAWMDANLEAGDKLNIDRFGRATLFRCSTDPNAQLMPKPAPKIGDGAYELYFLIELPPGAGHCPKPS